jgi:hypothetical protein
MWRVSWHTKKPSKRGGETSRTEHKNFTDEQHARGETLRFAKRRAYWDDAEWCKTEEVK